jgi:hypothetical protein
MIYAFILYMLIAYYSPVLGVRVKNKVDNVARTLGVGS